jgi:hypothetical protein
MNTNPGADAPNLQRNLMNARRLSAALFGSLLVGASLFARAPQLSTQTSTPNRVQHEENRAQRQQKRIAQGVASGSLTPKETARVERQEARINKNIAKAQADGKVTKKEATKIQKEQNRESRRIYRQKHDARNVK